MTPGELFQIANPAVLPGWILLLCAPGWRWTHIIAGFVLPALLSLSYAGIVGLHFGEAQGNFSSLAGVKTLFANDWVLVGGWVHYLAFDLFTGCWEVRDSRRLSIAHFYVLPCLVLTFLLGPAGLLLYLALRLALRRKQYGFAEMDRI